MGSILPCNIAGLISNFSKDCSHPNRQKLPSSTTPLSFDAPPRGTPGNIRIHLIFSEPRVIGLQSFLSQIVCVYLDSFSRCCLPNVRTSAKFRENLNLKQFKVIDFGTNRKRICDFLLVINSNFCPILRRLWDIREYGDLLAENCVFFLPLLFGAPAPYVPFGISW